MATTGGTVSAAPSLPTASAVPSSSSSSSSSLAALPHPFTTWTMTPSCRSLVDRLLPALITSALKGLEDWKAGVRKAAAGQLRSTIVVAQDLLVPHVQALFAGLCRASRDEEADIRAVVGECAALIGRFLDPAVQLGAWYACG